MGAGAVDDQRVQLGVVDRGLAEQLAEFLLGIGVVLRQPLDERIRNIVQHIRLAGVLSVVPQSLPDIFLRLLDNFLDVNHHFFLLNIPSLI